MPREEVTEGVRHCPLCPVSLPINALPTHLLGSHAAGEVTP